MDIQISNNISTLSRKEIDVTQIETNQIVSMIASLVLKNVSQKMETVACY
jgi:hypothetical protein